MYTELKNNDLIVFNQKTGSGSIVETKNHGCYFMPAKIGMRLSGIKTPLRKNEQFIYNNYVVQKAEGFDRIIKLFITRIQDGKVFAISEDQLHKNFAKLNRSSLGGID